jgi:hypothetical protein
VGDPRASPDTERIEDGGGRSRYGCHSARQKEGWSGGPRHHSGDWTRRYGSELQQDSPANRLRPYDRIYEPYALPDTPDDDALNAFLVEAYRQAWGW